MRILRHRVDDTRRSILSRMSDATELAAWSAPAVNLPEHADNAIHTDAGARAAGFPSALVAGVTVYAYMTHVPAAAWGLDWLRGGGAHVRFRSPIFDHDLVNYVPTAAGPQKRDSRSAGRRSDALSVHRGSRGQPARALHRRGRAARPDRVRR